MRISCGRSFAQHNIQCQSIKWIVGFNSTLLSINGHFIQSQPADS